MQQPPDPVTCRFVLSPVTSPSEATSIGRRAPHHPASRQLPDAADASQQSPWEPIWRRWRTIILPPANKIGHRV